MTPAHTFQNPSRRLPSGPLRTFSRAFPWSLLVMAGVVALDQVTKWLVVEFLSPETAYSVVGDIARIYVIRNSGAAFSMGENATPVFAVIQLLAALLCIYLAFRARTWWSMVAVGLIGGGAAGNFIDRVFRAPGALHGHVVDFISVGDFAIFNIADSAITVGVVVYLIYGVFIEPRQQGHKGDMAPEHTEDGDGADGADDAAQVASAETTTSETEQA